jgi:uncharacterized membrane protein YphA (DoxX/SURF4 family)
MNLTAFEEHERLRTRLATVLDLGRVPLRAAAPVVDLLVLLTLAKAFFAPGMFPGIGAADFPTAWPMIIVQVIGPVLVAVGLLGRPVALLMLVLTLRAQFRAQRKTSTCSGQHCSAGTSCTVPHRCRSTAC